MTRDARIGVLRMDEGSDVDVLLLLDSEVDVALEIIRVEEVKWPLSLEAGYTISLLPVSFAYYRNSAEPFVQNVRSEGVAVARARYRPSSAKPSAPSLRLRCCSKPETPTAASRAYYGCFYVAEALLLSEGLRFSRHGQVISQYGRLFAKEDRLDRRLHRLLDRSFSLRQAADYTVELPINVDETRKVIEEGRAFLAASRDHLDRREAENNGS